jgi:hypothetical protein
MVIEPWNACPGIVNVRCDVAGVGDGDGDGDRLWDVLVRDGSGGTA